MAFASLNGAFYGSSGSLSGLPIESEMLILNYLIAIGGVPTLPHSRTDPVLKTLTPILASTVFSDMVNASSAFLVATLQETSALLISGAPQAVGSFPGSCGAPPTTF